MSADVADDVSLPSQQNDRCVADVSDDVAAYVDDDVVDDVSLSQPDDPTRRPEY